MLISIGWSPADTIETKEILTHILHSDAVLTRMIILHYEHYYDVRKHAAAKPVIFCLLLVCNAFQVLLDPMARARDNITLEHVFRLCFHPGTFIAYCIMIARRSPCFPTVSCKSTTQKVYHHPRINWKRAINEEQRPPRRGYHVTWRATMSHDHHERFRVQTYEVVHPRQFRYNPTGTCRSAAPHTLVPKRSATFHNRHLTDRAERQQEQKDMRERSSYLITLRFRA